MLNIVLIHEFHVDEAMPGKVGFASIRGVLMAGLNRNPIRRLDRAGEMGVTLLESLVVLAIVAILLTAAVPGFVEQVRDARLHGHVSEVVSTLNLARSEAVKRGMKVTVCPSSDGLQCTGAANWEAGWIVFPDANSNGIVDEDDAIVKVRESLEDSSTVRGSRNRLTYRSNGFSSGFTDTLRVCDQRGTAKARSVIVSNLGRVRISNGTAMCP